MKAVKLYKIEWNLEGVEPEKLDEVKGKLPVVKGFTCSDDFNVADKVPGLLKTKFGYDIDTFSFTEIHIIDDLKDLILLGALKGEKKKDVFRLNGKMSLFGKECLETLKEKIEKRKEMEGSGILPEEMPKAMDELMLAVEAVTGLNWEDCTAEELFEGIVKKINSLSKTDILKKYKPDAVDDEEDPDEDPDEEGLEEE